MLFLTGVTLLALQSGFTGCLGEITVKLLSFDQCQEEQDTAVTLNDVVLTKTGPYKMKVDATVEITKEVGDLKCELFLTKCESREQQHTCSQDLKMTIEDICEHLSDKDKMWSEGVEHMEEFDPHCPIKPGAYKMVDAEFDAESLSQVPALDGFWKVKSIGTDNGNPVSCQVIEVEIDTGIPLV